MVQAHILASIVFFSFILFASADLLQTPRLRRSWRSLQAIATAGQFLPIPNAGRLQAGASPNVGRPQVGTGQFWNAPNARRPQVDQFLSTAGQFVSASNARRPQAAASQFLSAHNAYRSQYNLPPLQWDNKLARFARRYALQRSNDCEMIHSTSSYGENLFWGGKDAWQPQDVVKRWVDERTFYNMVSLQCMPNRMCGHFTQVVWKDTQRVGCGSSTCKNGGGRFFVCTYDPPGNFADESPFGGLKKALGNVLPGLPFNGVGA